MQQTEKSIRVRNAGVFLCLAVILTGGSKARRIV